MSTQNNRLLCCYILKETVPNLTNVIEQLYKRDERCSYSRSALDSYFGTDAFRTFKYDGMNNLFEVYIEDLKEDDTELSKNPAQKILEELE